MSPTTVVLSAVRRCVASVVCMLGALAVLAGPAQAATVQADCQTLGSALSAANDGDTIVLTGMCTAPNANFTLPAKAGLTIEGAPTGTNGFDGTAVTSPALASPAAPTGTNGITVENLTFENYASSAAVEISSPTQTGSTFTHPYAFIDDTFTNDSDPSSSVNGGGLSLLLSPASCPSLTTPDVTLSGSTFTNDRAVGTAANNGTLDGGGGGAALDLECPESGGIGATTAVTGNTFANDTVNAPNSESRQGGGLWVGLGRLQNSAQSAITQSNNVFDQDSITGTGGSYLGGGEYTAGYNVTSVGDHFVGNHLAGPTTSAVSSEGGGLATLGGGSCTGSVPTTSQFTNLVATGNSIAGPTGSGTGDSVEGAGIYAGCGVGGSGYHLTLTNATVSGNTASGAGAVAGVDGEASDSLVLQNSIVFGDSGGAEIGGFGATDGANATASFSDACAIGSTTTPFAGSGNICADPALANVQNGDVHETAASPTIDAGSNALVPNGVTGDFYGAPRILVGKLGDAPTVDIGAAEFKPPAPVNSTPPVISGNPVQGQTLSTTDGTWNGTTSAFAYQWQDCDTAGNACSDITGATANTYVLGSGDVGHTLRVVVTAINAGGSASASSGQTAIVTAPAPAATTATPAPAPAPTLPPTLTGVHFTPSSFTAKKGTTLEFSLSSPATLTVVITQTLHGHKVNGRCHLHAKHGKRCTVTVHRATRTLRGLAGANHIKLNLSHLAPGRYRATISASNSAGTSRSVTLTFVIKPPAKRHRH